MNWPSVPLSSAFEFIRNGMSVKQDSGAGGLPITRIETISDGTVNPRKVGFAGLGYPEATRWMLQEGDILFSHINSFEHVGKCAVYRGEPAELVHGMNLLCFRAEKAKLDPEYAKHLLRSRGFRAQLERFINKAVNQASVSIGNLSNIPITLLPLDEQRRIAAILDRAEELRAKRRAAIALLDQLPQAIFLEMFGDPKTNPKGWPVGSLTDPSVAVIFGGGTPSRATPAYFEGDICWATSKDIKRDILTDTQEHVTAEAVAKSATKIVPSGSLLVVVKSKILARTLPLAISQVPVCFGQDLKGIVPNKSESVHFLFHSLKAGERWLLERARGINTEGLTLEHLRDFPLAVPPTDLQGRFGAKVQAIHSAKAAHQSALGKLDSLTASLQATAFRGEF